MNRNDLTILIVSCDGYSDLWDPAMKLFDIYWANCDFPVVLGSNYVSFYHPKIKSILVGEDKSWSDSVYKMLLQIESSHVIVMLEDFFLTDFTQNSKIESLFKWSVENNIDCCRLIKNSFDEGKKIGETDGISLFEIKKFTPYRICTQAAIWNKQYLMALLNPKYSAWYFEGANSMLVNYTQSKIVSVEKTVLNYKHAVERGKWIAQGIDNLKKNNIEFDFDNRGYFEFNKADIKTRKDNFIVVIIVKFILFFKYLPDLILLKSKLRKIHNHG